ncbi:hypothetical protein AAFL31_16360 [Klebsiella huaxiensis]|uniref:hypothetical protein n=1 Tax=Klebsiella huaxiensis TaxID=2153354 RepID=UPI003162A64A
MFNKIDSHRKQPDVTLEQHVKNKRIQLGSEISGKYKIYLDLRFWIFFRDIELGINHDENFIQLLNQIKSLVDNGTAICPISEAVFIELMKQSDEKTRLATAKLIDSLSFGITLIVSPERIMQELANAFYSMAGVKNIISIDNLVWTKLSYIFGETHPYQTSFEPDEELVIQKSFFDRMEDITLTEMMGYFNFESWEQFNWQALADQLNLGNQEHAGEVRSYQQAYRVEFEGGLSLFSEQLLQLFKEVSNAGYDPFSVTSEKLSDQQRLKKFSKLVRTLHIGACCHSAVRWDQKRQLTGNDLLDFHHAEAALGYCNLFLTEKPLKTLVSQNHLGLMDDFPCAVESSAIGGLRVLTSIKD